ncbi:hypothetical protein [Amycolatopsis sp. FDAARGOS 1241]|uniref:hypothetical protein n=1 Tax=Amycolatopsis sp. FDAARGOS 1241 TaxID=2778070 RepID=UPI00194E2572|nr:hypothetical protein [Amycolatopsis sp. FDAARGOS 1241]QRP48009.1 hypothetical protein I6J71_09030 [Amycolatopsis sp. FDAARGOS 1241]
MAAERTIRIKFDGSSEGLVAAAAAARAEMKALSDDAKKRSKALSDVGARIGGMARGVLSLAQNLSTVATAANVLPVLVAGVFTLAGALPLAVAGGFALAGVMATMKLGADGAKRAFDKLTPTLNTLKANVSSSFEKALNPAVRNLQTLLPRTTTGFQSIATAIGGVATKVTAYLATAKATSQINTILGGTSRVVQNIGAFLAPVIAAFLRIGAVAMPILVQLTSGIGTVGEKFNAFVQTAANNGSLQQWIQGALAAFQQIFGVLTDLGSIVSSVFGAIQDAGGSSFGFIGPLISTVQQFLDSAQGHDTLVGFFQSLNSVAGSVSQVVGALLAAIGPAIPPLAASIASLANTISGILVPVIQFLAPVLQNIANFIQQNTSWITPLVIALGLWAAAQWALNIAMDANPIGLIILAIGALIAIVATIITYWTPIKDFFLGIFNAIKDAVVAAAKWIGDRFSDAWNFIVGVWNGVIAWFQAIWTGIKAGVGLAVQFVRDRFSDAWNFIKSVWGKVSSFFSGIWSGIGDGLKSALNGAIRLLNGAIHGINKITGVVGIPGIPDIPYLARGGTARGGRPYIVGERGPELFVPGQTGRVVSHQQSFGGPQQIVVPIQIGDEVTRVVRFEIDRNTGQVRRLAGAGTGSMK